MNYLESLSNRYSIVVALFLVGIIVATACSGPTAVAPGEEGSDTAPLTQRALRNAEYQGIYQDPVRLTDGKYEGEPFVEGGASRPTVTLTDAYAFGDLDGDGVDDAVVVLVESSGGSGSFLYLAAVLNRDGNPENVATQLLGDRGQIQAIAITEGGIVVDVVTHGPDDPMCCPTQEVTLEYRLEGEQLIKLSEETTGSDVVGKLWKWERFDDAAGDANVVDDDPDRYTLELRPDGTYRVKADCNLSGGGYTLEGNSITLLPGPTTLAECEPGSLYDEYLARLGQVVTFALDGDRLVLNLSADAGNVVFIGDEASTSEASDAGAEIVDVPWQ